MIRRAKETDIAAIVKLFSEVITEHPEYISHGEIQMGIADGPGALNPDFEELWKKYLKSQLTAFPPGVLVWDLDGALSGFVIATTGRDMAEPFGIINDLCVKKSSRDAGIGRQLLDSAYEVLAEQGIDDVYLESGVQNESAHDFFEKMGFSVVSKIFRKRME